MKTRLMEAGRGEREKRTDQAERQAGSSLLLPTRWTVRLCSDWLRLVRLCSDWLSFCACARAERQVRGAERRAERLRPWGEEREEEEEEGETRLRASSILAGSLVSLLN